MVLNPPVLGKAWPLFRDPLLAKPRGLLSGFFLESAWSLGRAPGLICFGVLGLRADIAALIIRIGCWGPFYI